MTKQIPDRVLYKGQEYILAGLKGHGLLTPWDFGIPREMLAMATTCTRSYYSQYECLDNQLFLMELTIVHQENVQLPLIERVSAQSQNSHFSSYSPLRVPCPLSGGLILVRNPIGLECDFPNPVDFEEVTELLFEDGILQRMIDHSTTVAALPRTVGEWSFVSGYEQQPR
jgi:hypothetical protein